jgi:hypothetical protein
MYGGRSGGGFPTTFGGYGGGYGGYGQQSLVPQYQPTINDLFSQYFSQQYYGGPAFNPFAATSLFGGGYGGGYGGGRGMGGRMRRRRQMFEDLFSPEQPAPAPAPTLMPIPDSQVVSQPAVPAQTSQLSLAASAPRPSELMMFGGSPFFNEGSAAVEPQVALPAPSFVAQQAKPIFEPIYEPEPQRQRLDDFIRDMPMPSIPEPPAPSYTPPEPPAYEPPPVYISPPSLLAPAYEPPPVPAFAPQYFVPPAIEPLAPAYDDSVGMFGYDSGFYNFE